MTAPKPTLILTADDRPRDRSRDHQAPLLAVRDVRATVEPRQAKSNSARVHGARMPRYVGWIVGLVGASLLGWAVWVALR